MNMKLLLALALASAAVPLTASAQVAGAIGKPLPSADLPAGTVSVKIVAGKIQDVVPGVEVTLVVNGAPRVARTDTGGRAAFPGLPAGATVQAKVADQDGKQITSDEFQVAADSGQRVLLSTKPFQAMGGGEAPFAGGGGGAAGMPDPRQLSGQPRPEATDQPGSMTVRLTYDNLLDKKNLDKLPVFLTGYKSDDSVIVYKAVSDAEGRAVFSNLDRSGNTSYFATALMPRGGVVDRLVSSYAVLDSRAGIRMILSADKLDSTAPPIDDLTKLDKQDNAPKDPNLVRVTAVGVPEETGQIELVAYSPGGAKRTVATKPLGRAAPDPQDVSAQDSFKNQPDLAPHVLHVQVHGGGPDDNKPLGGVSIRLVPADAVKDPDADLSKIGTEQKTPDAGFFEITDSTKGPLVAHITINGREMNSEPFDISNQGGVLDINAHWDTAGKLIAEFDVSQVGPDEVLAAQTTMFNNKSLFRTIPFQKVPGHGTHATLFVYPRILFEFSLTSRIDDEFLAVGGKFDITNNSWAPYVGGDDGLVIPLPKNFKGARVAEQDQDDVAVAQGEGYRIGRPIPPGGKVFHGTFSLPVENGTAEWSMDLPLGAFNSGLEILQTPGMSVETPKGVRGQVATVPQGTYYVLPQISIKPKQSMNMTISNLPSQPAWKTWAPRIVAVVAILVMLGGVWFTLQRTSKDRSADQARAKRRQELLDELVELERTGAAQKSDQKRRDQITKELEQLWVD